MPLDLFLHHTLPQVMAGAMHVDPLDAERIVGAFEAAILALLAVAFARALELHGAAALVTVAATALEGWLALFTGYGKAFRELSVVVLAVAAFGVRLVRSGRGIVPLGLAVAVGLALHRSGVGLLPRTRSRWPSRSGGTARSPRGGRSRPGWASRSRP